MPKPKTYRRKPLDQGTNETEVQPPSELTEHIMADLEVGKGTDAESNSILLAIRSMNKTMTDGFDTLEMTLASTQASLVSLRNRYY
ncbi:unnamed protein product [Scomber scombrus]|uniref:Unnamed protein product n=1 Tax=Scomber scombrus TaxID=13677 RepID=A0AAV1PFN5_SCOSC